MRRISTSILVSLLSVSWFGPAQAQNSDVHKQKRAGPITAAPAMASLPTEARTQAIERYGNLPLSFEINEGQAQPKVEFISRTTSRVVYFSHDGLWVRGVAAAKNGAPPLEMTLAGANPSVVVQGMDKLPGKTNYLIGNDPKRWRHNVPTFAKARYSDIYPGIDLVYYGNQSKLECDFNVKPGADPHSIRLDFRGSHFIRIENDGDLLVKAAGNQIRFSKPIVYQIISPQGGAATQRRSVDGHYAAHGHEVRFEIGAYDKTKALVIDPILSYSTFLGGSSAEFGSAIAVDSGGNAYVTGQTASVDFPVTTGATQPSLGGSYDVFVTKINSSGTAFVYSTYLGGSNNDYGQGIAVDANGNAFVTGSTLSADFPSTPGAFRTCAGCNPAAVTEAFAVKLDPTGASLVYSTYIGSVVGEAISIDAAGNAYITGAAGTNTPTTPGAFQETCPPARGCDAAFVSKVNTTGSALVYSTYLGGSGGEAGYGIAVDKAGETYVVGGTYSADFPTTAGSFRTACNPPGSVDAQDAFVTKLTADGAKLMYSGCLGGGNADWALAVALDSTNSAYVTGYSFSADFPVTTGAFQSTCRACTAGTDSAFVTKINQAGSGFVYSTYLGGSSSSAGRGIAVDATGRAYITGDTVSLDFPTTDGAIQTSYAGNTDAFVSVLGPQGDSLPYSTFLGGSNADQAFGLALDQDSNVYVVGTTASFDFPATIGAPQSVNHSGGYYYPTDAFITKMPTVAVPSQTGTISVSTNVAAAGFVITGPASLSGSGIRATFLNAPVGTYSIAFSPVTGYGTPTAALQVLTAGGSISFVGTYTPIVVLPAPIITSFAPTTGVTGEHIYLFTIAGQNFQQGATVSFSGGQSITVDSGSLVVTPTFIQGNATVNSTANAGTYDITITNPDRQLATKQGVLTIQVIPPAPQNLSAVVGNGSIYLRWDPSTNPVDEYRASVEQATSTSSLNSESTSMFAAGVGVTYQNVGTLSCQPPSPQQAPSCLLTTLPDGTGIQNNACYRITLTAVRTGMVSTASAPTVACPNSPRIGSYPTHPPHPILFLHGFTGDGSFTSSGSFYSTLSFMKNTLSWRYGGQLYHVGDELESTHVNQQGVCPVFNYSGVRSASVSR